MVNIDKTIYFLNREQEERHTQELAKKLNLPYINLTGYPLTLEVLKVISEELAIFYQIIPYLKIGKVVKIGVVNPNKKGLKEVLEKIAKEKNIEFVQVVVSQSSFLYGILLYDRTQEEAGKKANKAGEEERSLEDVIKDEESLIRVAGKTQDTKLLDVIVYGGIRLKASDIHLEPGESVLSVRYRLDGVLREVLSLPMSNYKILLSRIKYLAKMRMDKKTEPQDGRFSFKTIKSAIDLRVSVLPSSYGESIVLRILSQEKGEFGLSSLGFRKDALELVKSAISRPNGMILTSGPTGSGKTSTMYAVLKELNKPEVKIITLEDPVEYRIAGVEQSQIDKEHNYDFASGLKAILRQDPDIVMVGEIRDPETAEIAIQAAMTGHLLLSTIHANSAPAVFVRLLEIGVKPFLLAGSINLVMAQRLVRKVCEKCVEEYEPRPEVWQEIQKILEPIKSKLDPGYQAILNGVSVKLKRGVGCSACGNSGFSGRQVIIEVLKPDQGIETLISKKASISEFQKATHAQGMITMEQDGLVKVLQGITTVEEVWRVTKQ